jgi:sigma-B regulation protein RsbU (phosphoserine phosphatase)
VHASTLTVAEEVESTPDDVVRVESALHQLEEGQRWVDYPPTREEADAPLDLTKPARYELVLPVRAGSELLGCLALPVKLSEQPYSREDKELLQGVAQAVGMALKNAMLVVVAKREAQQARDLEIARGVQQGLFPRILPAVPGWEFAAGCLPAQAVGGDYYDLFQVETGKIAFAVGDVSGKGLGASLLMANLHALMRSLLPRAAGDLAAFTTEVNEHLVTSSPSGMFVTLFVGVLDTATGELRYVNGGHPPALVFSGVGGDMQRLETGGLLVGAIPGIRYEVGEVALAPGSVLAIYSDGVTEANNTAGEMYEEERLVDALAVCCRQSAAEVFSGVMESVQGFSRGAEQADDITLVVIQRAGGVSNAGQAHAESAVETTE